MWTGVEQCTLFLVSCEPWKAFVILLLLGMSFAFCRCLV
uniref:Uncharacterized protein n=1 Tax=Anguilla anguilla TaxID=7936 RepID=A0A0E9VQ68_ANGAN